nr:tetratricopeptide repeat protein [Acidobacteriota bacterium]
MNLASQLVRKIDDQTLSREERVQLRCQLAKELEEAGNFEAARSAMGELWQRIGDRPKLDGLDQHTSAEVLLRVGTLSGWIGSAKQIEGAQEIAKNLISESVTIFQALQAAEKVAESRVDLAICYWREGASDEARVILRDTLSQLVDIDSEQKARALMNSAIVEASTNRLNDALRILTEAAPLFGRSHSHAMKGRFHTNLALVLKNLGEAEQREDYIDRALVENAAASFHLEQAGHIRYRAGVENNLGFLFSTAGKFTEAHNHLDRARRLFVSLKDSVHTAQVDETRARAFLAEGRNQEAEKVARAAVRTLEKGDEHSLLAEALRTYAVAVARLGHQDRARVSLERAIEVAEQAGDIEGGGVAALTMIEELDRSLTPDEMSTVYERADDLLARTQHPGTPVR